MDVSPDKAVMDGEKESPELDAETMSCNKWFIASGVLRCSVQW